MIEEKEKEFVLDPKLETLIKLCVKNDNYDRLAKVGYSLVSNALNDIGVKIGIRARNKFLKETACDYVKIINNIVVDNLKIYLIPRGMADQMYVIENQIKRGRNLTKGYVMKLFDIYFELVKIEVPDLNSGATSSLNVSPGVKLLSFLSSSDQKANKKIDRTSTIFMSKINERQNYLQKQLNRSFNGAQFKEMVYLKGFGDSIKKKNKTSVEGSLNNNLIYRSSVNDIAAFFLLGGALVMFLLGLATLIESVLFSFLSISLSTLYAMFFGSSAMLFGVFYKYFWKDK